jgi:hypothetical protein
MVRRISWPTYAVGVGRVMGPYCFNNERGDHIRCVPVDWFHTAEYPIADKSAVSGWFS